MRRIDILNKSYQNFLLNIPIPALNNHTLREVFEEGIFNLNSEFDTVSNWVSFGGTYIVLDGVATQTGNGAQTYMSFHQDILLNGHKYYHVSRSRIIYNNAVDFRILISGNTTKIQNNPIINEWYILSAVYTATISTRFQTIINYGTTLLQNGSQWQVDYYRLYDMTSLGIDTLTISQMDYWYKVFIYFRYQEFTPGISYPNFFIPTDPTGFGNRYSLLELNKIPYGQELDFDNIQLNLVMGINNNPYTIYNKLMNFLIDNECIIEYDYGSGIRYTDVRLLNAPKTEMEPGRIIRSKFDFKRLTPFYTLLQGSTIEVLNTHDWKLKPSVQGTVNTNIVYIDAEDLATSETMTVKFDFTSVTKPFNFYYNSETKQILINGVNIGYKYIDLAYGKTFLELEKDIHYGVTTTGITNPIVTIKKWVID